MNAFEELARARKVARIVAALPFSADTACNLDALAYLESATPEQRADFARKHAGLKNPPSERTWRLVCEAYRARIQPANGNAGDPANHITRG